jgi:hypothetical protein
MTVLISDSFNRTNSTTTIGTSDSYTGGTNTAWTVYGGQTYGIKTNQIYQVTTTKADYQFAGFNAGISNAKVTATFASMPSAGDKPYMIIRATDANNYLFFMGGAGKVYELGLCQNGGTTWTTLATGGTGVNGDVAEVTCNGNSIVVKVNGTQIISTTVTQQATGTLFGLCCGAQQASTFDNFIIEDLGTSGTTYAGSGTVQGLSSLNQVGSLILKGSATVQGTANVSSTEKAILKAIGTALGYSSLSSQEVYRYKAIGTLQGLANLTGLENYRYQANGIAQGYSTLSSGDTLLLFSGNVYSASGTAQGYSTMSSGEKSLCSALGTVLGCSDNQAQEIVHMVASGITQGYSEIILIESENEKGKWRSVGQETIKMVAVVEPTENNWKDPEITVILFK